MVSCCLAIVIVDEILFHAKSFINNNQRFVFFLENFNSPDGDVSEEEHFVRPYVFLVVIKNWQLNHPTLYLENSIETQGTRDVSFSPTIVGN